MDELYVKVGEAAVLIHGRYSPTYNISSINEETGLATCVWYDVQKRKTVTEQIPLNVLRKHIEPEPINAADIMKALSR